MYKIMIKNKVKDFDAWHKIFMDNEDFRRKAGAGDWQVFRSIDDKNSILVILEWKDEEKAKAWSESTKLHDLQQKAGVISKPEIYVLEDMKMPEAEKM